jgi:hypothetical protein
VTGVQTCALPIFVMYAAALLVSERLYMRGSVSWKGRLYGVNRDS